jgi:hypothetical protein
MVIKRLLNDISPNPDNLKIITANSGIRPQMTNQSFILDSLLVRESIDIPPTANIKSTIAKNSKMKVEDYDNIAAIRDTEKTNSVNEVSGRDTI